MNVKAKKIPAVSEPGCHIERANAYMIREPNAPGEPGRRVERVRRPVSRGRADDLRGWRIDARGQSGARPRLCCSARSSPGTSGQGRPWLSRGRCRRTGPRSGSSWSGSVHWYGSRHPTERPIVDDEPMVPVASRLRDVRNRLSAREPRAGKASGRRSRSLASCIAARPPLLPPTRSSRSSHRAEHANGCARDLPRPSLRASTASV